MSAITKRIATSLGGAMLVTSSIFGLVSTPAVAATSPVVSTTTTTTTTTATADTAPSHVLRGSEVTFINRSATDVFVPGHGWVSPGGQVFMKGANDHSDDVAFTVITEDDRKIPVYVHNPLTSSAYLQVEGTKMEFDGIVSAQGKNFSVDYIAEGVPGPPPVTLTDQAMTAENLTSETTAKRWVLEYLDENRPWALEHIHHTGENDGVKGFVVNHTGADLHLRIGGHLGDVQTLRAGERLMFFDAHELDSGRGTKIQIMHSSGSSMVTEVELGDPYIGTAHAKVWNARSEMMLDQSVAEGFKQSFVAHPQYYDSMLHLSRDNDQALPTEHDNWHTEDWAVFTLEITRRG